MRNVLRLITLLGLTVPMSACLETHPASSTGGDADPGSQTGITVSGQGKASGTPDVLEVDVGVSVLRKSVSEAMSDATRLSDAVRNAVLAQGVAREDLQTSRYAIAPEYEDTEGKGDRHIVGYRVTNTLLVKIRKLDRAGETLDAVAKAGGNDVVVRSLRFTIQDDKALLVKAREAAWKDAQAKAEELARLAGVELGDPISIDESVGPRPILDRGFAATAEIATPIEPGQLDVTVSVTVRFAIGDQGPIL